MGILTFLLIAGACAGLYWFINFLFAPPPIINKIMLVAIVILLVMLLLQAIGLFPIGDVAIPRVR